MIELHEISMAKETKLGIKENLGETLEDSKLCKQEI